MIWEPGDVERVKKLWGEGKSATKIGVVLGRSRNSVISKVSQLKLSRRAPASALPHSTGGRPKVRVAGARFTASKPIVESIRKPSTVVPIRPYQGAADWTEREKGQCAFPLGKVVNGHVLNCCKPTGRPGTRWSYCPDHLEAMGQKRRMA
jgi:hypothetical protein